MKRFTQLVCMLLILSVVLTVPAYAAEASSRASHYFLSTSCYLWELSGSQFQVWFEVAAVDGMDELGASVIKVQRSTDRINWTTVQTYTKESYPSLIARGTGYHQGCVTYTRSSGYYYRAYVEFYAKNSSGSAYYDSYTSYI